MAFRKMLMKFRSIILVIVFLATTALFLQAGEGQASGDVSKGKTHYRAICATCHGQNAEGQRALNAPKLAGQHDWYLIRQLQNFKSGVRGGHPQDIYGTQMRQMAQTLADDQAIQDVVAYIKTLRS